MKTKFKTRKRGTPKQIGQVFPILPKKKLPARISINSKPSIKNSADPRWIDYYDVCEFCGEAYEMYHMSNEEWNRIVPKEYQDKSICKKCLQEKFGGKITQLASPLSGAPLEPPTELGDTVLYDPYSGTFAELSPERALGRVTPKYTMAEAVGMSMAKSYISQAAQIGKDKGKSSVSLDDFRKAAMLMSHAQRVEPWHAYPEAGLQRNVVFRQIKDVYPYVTSMLQSAVESEGEERQKYIDRGMESIRSLDAAMGASGGKISPAKLRTAIDKEMKEHPWAGRKTAARIARDHLKSGGKMPRKVHFDRVATIINENVNSGPEYRRIKKSWSRIYRNAILNDKEKPRGEDYRIVDNFVDLVAPEYMAKGDYGIRKFRRSWGKILLSSSK